VRRTEPGIQATVGVPLGGERKDVAFQIPGSRWARDPE